MRSLAWLLALTALGCTTSFDLSTLRARDAGGGTADVPPEDRAEVSLADATDVTDATDATDVTDPTDAADVTDATDVVDAGGCGGPSQRCCVGAAVPCLAGTICNEGYCVACPGASLACAGVCVDPQTSLAHCGRCGNACANGQSCVGGTCTLVCPAGLTACGDRCVDIGRNSSHCSRCDAACEGGQLCAGGSCIVMCAPGETNCGGACVDTATSLAHCGQCGGACRRDNAVTRCSAGLCAFATCESGFGDCDMNPANGCEARLDTISNCGRCGARCLLANAAVACRAGACEVDRCDVGFENCDLNQANGCEADVLRDVRNCGRCGVICPPAPVGQVAACVLGRCQNVTANCAQGRAECGGASALDCETDITTTRDCGRCGNVCSVPNAVNRCVAGSCAVEGCAQDFANCDGSLSNGCEADLRTSVANCGGCGRACTLANATAQCVSRSCAVLACTQGYADCDGNPNNGCEVNLRSSVSDCGACGSRCAANNGTAACTNGQCAITACNPGFANCDGSLSNGCEVRTVEDPTNCGACRNACVLPNATPQCVAGVCQVAECADGFANCDGVATNGCEVNLRTSTQHCGACNRQCSVTNGSGACVMAQCRVASCSAGFADCDTNPGNGCETSTNSATNCGACGNVCPSGAVCSQGACASLCGPGFTFCSGSCYVLASDPRHCGACDRLCPSRPNATATCAAGQCGIACAVGWADCDGVATNGCEARLDSRENCGACGLRCGDAPNATGFCSGGACGLTCSRGFLNCDGVLANGCEVNVLADPNNCGNCFTRCGRFTNSVPVCRDGSCSYACNVGWGNCDGALGNGCEVNLFADDGNCAGCGSRCGAGSCRGGVCTLCLSSGADNLTNCGGVIGAVRCDNDIANDPQNCGGCGQVCPSVNRPDLHASFSGGCMSGRCVMTCQSGWDDCDGNWQNGCEVNTTCDRQHCGACNRSGFSCLGGQVCCNGMCEQFGRNSCSLSAPGCR